MSFLLAVFLAFFGVTILTHVVVCVVFRFFKVGIEEFQLFYGKPVLSGRIGGSTFKLGWLPTGLSTKWDEASYQALPKVAKAGLQFVLPLLLVLVGVLLLGAGGAWHHLLTGFRQCFEGAFRPQNVGWVLLQKLELLYRASPQAFVGVLAVKLAAIQLMPFGVSAPTMALSDILKRPEEEMAPLWLHTIMIYGAMLTWICSLIWLGLGLVYAFKGEV